MAENIQVEMTDAQVRNFTLSSLVTTQAMLSVVLNTQARILAKLNQTDEDAELKALGEAVTTVERELVSGIQRPEESAPQARRRSAPASIVR